MFASYDLSNFGLELRRIRVDSGYTQKTVSNLSGINTDTLRKIENGNVIPKYETLELLSCVYRYDLLSILSEKRINADLLEIYNALDSAIIDNSGPSVNKLKDLFNIISNTDSKVYNSINLTEQKQLKLIIKAIESQLSDNNEIYLSSKFLLYDILKISRPEFSIGKIQEYKYNRLEVRALMLLALTLLDTNSLESSIVILQYLYDNYIDRNYIDIKLLVKIITNLSFNYHRIDNEWNSLLYAEIGILLCRENHSTYCLPYLLSRKAISHLLLCLDGVEESVNLCLSILKLSGHKVLENEFRDVFMNKYNISI